MVDSELENSRPYIRLIALIIALLLLLLVAWEDHDSNWILSFSLLYLIPVYIATRYVGRYAGLLMAFVAGGCAMAGQIGNPSFASIVWNSCEQLGIFVIFSLMLGGRHIIKSWRGGLTLTAGCALCLAVATTMAKHNVFGQPAVQPATPNALLKQLAIDVPAVMGSSRPVLLGSRSPTGPSCVTPIKTGQVTSALPSNPGDFDGGPGTRLATLYTMERQSIDNAPADFNWHQTRFRTFLSNEAALNSVPMKNATKLAKEAADFLALAQQWDILPPEVQPTGFSRHDDWPSYCLWSLDKAIKTHDLVQTKHWASELASASFSLADLHRWLDFLVTNHLQALDFQAKCKDVFDNFVGPASEYQHNGGISRLPAGMLGLNGFGNYYEIERQGERMYSMPPDRVAELATNHHLTDGSVWVTPAVRECFLKLEGALNDENKKTWERAARTPFEHSYLINMLYRAWQADTADEQAAVLKVFDQLHPQATVAELMSVLMYRGHSFAGFEWSDRFQAPLMDAASKVHGSDTQALLQAADWAHEFYTTDGAKYGVTFTLRDALQKRILDCVRATDMIAAIYRNAGRAHFAHLRICSETLGHSVAAVGVIHENQRQIYTVDALAAKPQLENWPAAYIHGHTWPPGMEKNSPPFSAELYARGLDNYIWSEGLIIRGPNAGTYMTASVPYSPMHPEASTQLVNATPSASTQSAAAN